MTIAVLVQPHEFDAARAFIGIPVGRSNNTFLFYLNLTSTGWDWSGYDLASSIAEKRKNLPIVPFPIFITLPLNESLILANFPEFFL